MINTNMIQARRWYYNAVIGCIVCKGYTRREARRMARKFRLRKQLRKYGASMIRGPVGTLAAELIRRFA